MKGKKGTAFASRAAEKFGLLFAGGERSSSRKKGVEFLTDRVQEEEHLGSERGKETRKYLSHRAGKGQEVNTKPGKYVSLGIRRKKN